MAGLYCWNENLACCEVSCLKAWSECEKERACVICGFDFINLKYDYVSDSVMFELTLEKYILSRKAQMSLALYQDTHNNIFLQIRRN